MSTKNFASLLIASLLALSVTSCSKDDDDNGNNDLTASNLAGTYRMTSANGTVNGIPFDYLATLDDCQKDNLFTLNANLTYSVADAGVKCNPEENDAGTWALSADSITFQSYSGKITSFNGSRLEVTSSGTYQGNTGTVTFVFTEQ